MGMIGSKLLSVSPRLSGNDFWDLTSDFFVFHPWQVLSFTHPVSFHSAETFESLLGCLKMDDEKVAEAALQIFKNTGSKMEESFPHIKSYVSFPD